MTEKFDLYFEHKYPGMSKETETYRDEWAIYSLGYIDGMNHAIDVVTGQKKAGVCA